MERIATKKIRILGLFFVLLLFMSLCFLEHPVSAKSPVVVINAGHLAGSDSGAVGNGYREVDLNNALAVKTANTLKNAGYIVYLTHPIPGSDGISTLLNEPCSIGTTMKKAINAINPDLVLSVHHNSGGNSSGYQLYWSSARLDLDQVGIYEQGGLWADGSMSWMDSSPCSEAQNSLKMANILNNKFKGLGYVGPNGNNPIHERDDFIPSQSHAPAVLIEAGFISNSVEANRLADGNNQQKMANSITDSVNEFFGGSPTKDKTLPKAESVTNENSPTTDTIFTVYANGVTDTDTGVKKTSFAVWTTDNGQDDLKWHEGTYCGNNQWKVSVPIAEHGMELGLYVIDPYAEDYAGNQGSLGRTIIEVVRNSNISDGVSIEKINNEVFKVYAKGFSGYSEIVFPVWSENNGQDDIIWYSGIKQTDGSYASTVHTKEHGYDTGIYNAHVYGRNSSSVLVGLGGTSTTVSQMTAESVTASEVKDGKFKVTVSGINAPLGIRDIMIPVWSDHGGQDDLIWYTASKTSNDTYELTVDIKNHGYDTGEYIAHVYGTDNNNKMLCLGTTKTNVQGMTAENVTASEVKNGKFTVTVNGVNAPSGVKQISVPVWSSNSGQDDIIWYGASKKNDNTYELTVDIKNHGYDTGEYIAHVYGTDNNNKMLCLGTTKTNVQGMTAENVTASEVKNGKFTVTVNGVNAPSGVKQISVPVWSSNSGQDDIIWYGASKKNDNTYELTVDIKNHGYDTGEYIAHVYGTDNNGIQICIGTTSAMVEYNANIIPSIPFTKDTTIMGSTFVTASKLADYYNSKATYPQYYIDRGVTLEQFTQMYIDESNAEGVRAEVAFAQMLHETGYLKFGGDVKIGQFNFAGLGATGGVPGNTFVDYGDNATGIRMGIRAQVQHLKCYGSNEALNNPCVDPRWGDWIRLKATTVGKLAGTWAADKTYGDKLVAIMNSF